MPRSEIDVQVMPPSVVRISPRCGGDVVSAAPGCPLARNVFGPITVNPMWSWIRPATRSAACGPVTLNSP